HAGGGPACRGGVRAGHPGRDDAPCRPVRVSHDGVADAAQALLDVLAPLAGHLLVGEDDALTPLDGPRRGRDTFVQGDQRV
ncbi:hypothetical protein ABE10_01545, partial [Bacillus toyonensis]|nr:hypothetical protein [Bacillus toyonensis]